jgi:predicted AAA+ superfamily ATPase
VRAHLELLSATFMLRLLPPLLPPNLRKRLVKSPRVYVRDTGILHSLLDIEDEHDLLGHPQRGASWEGWVIENAIAQFPGWGAYFYRAASGAELDLVLEKGRRRVAVECKASAAPAVGPAFWNALADIGAAEAWVVAPVRGGYPIGRGARVASLLEFLREAGRRGS